MRRRRTTIAVACHTTLPIITTWPLVLHWRTHLPLGSEGVRTVPQFNLWTLQWNAERIAHGWRGYWDAPIFWPLHDSFARSEVQPLTGVLFWVWRGVGGNVGAYNLTLWTLLTLNGLAMSYLARRLGAAFVPALLVGAIAQTLAFVGNELGVIQLVPLFPIWLLAERLVSYRSSPRRGALLGEGAWLGALGLMSGYYALFAIVALLVLVPVLVSRVNPRRGRSVLFDLTIAAAIAFAIAGPLTLAQQSRTSGSGWTETTVLANSARPIDYLQHDNATLPVPWARARNTGQALFPGGFVVALALVGATTAWRIHRRVVAGSLAVMTVTAMLSYGLRMRIGELAPYAWLRDHAAGFDRLRSPFRAAVLVQVMLLILAALGLAWMWRRPAGRVLAVAFAVASVAETVHWDQPTAPAAAVATFDWVRWLGDAPAGPVAMIPFPPTGNVADYEDTTTAMLAGLEHGHPLLNGYTGLFPAEYHDLLDEMRTLSADPNELASLENAGTRYVVLRHGSAGFATISTALRERNWELRFAGATRDIWEFVAPS